MRFLTFDPGTIHFAFSALDLSIKRETLVCKLFASGYVTATIANLTHNQNHRIAKRRHAAVDEELPAYVSHIEGLITAHKPVWIGTERFQRRPGGGGGTLAESVGMMNGIMFARANQLNIRWTLYTAASWKNWLNDLGKAAGQPNLLTYLYKVGSNRGLKPHTVDTICMAAYLHSGDPKHLPYYTPTALINIVRGVVANETSSLPAEQRGWASPLPGAHLPSQPRRSQSKRKLRTRSRGTQPRHPRRRS